MTNWDSEFMTPLEGLLPAEDKTTETSVQVRLDTLLPTHSETGAVTFEAFKIYLDTMIDMVVRAEMPLAVIAISVDNTPTVRFFGEEGEGLIGRAIVRCVRQETRPHDVVGLASAGEAGIPTFVIACPLMNEESAAALAERLRVSMTAGSGGVETAWLTVSIGVASLSIEVGDADSLLNRAESALHRARRSGGGCVWRHTDILRQIIERSGDAPDAAAY